MDVFFAILSMLAFIVVIAGIAFVITWLLTRDWK